MISNSFSTIATDSFKIGAVSSITNIPIDTLRIWERRYSVVTPARSKKADRLYSREDINRLNLLKLLVDRICSEVSEQEILSPYWDRKYQLLINLELIK